MSLVDFKLREEDCEATLKTNQYCKIIMKSKVTCVQSLTVGTRFSVKNSTLMTNKIFDTKMRAKIWTWKAWIKIGISYLVYLHDVPHANEIENKLKLRMAWQAYFPKHFVNKLIIFIFFRSSFEEHARDFAGNEENMELHFRINIVTGKSKALKNLLYKI